jgi:hypothetical protein
MALPCFPSFSENSNQGDKLGKGLSTTFVLALESGAACCTQNILTDMMQTLFKSRHPLRDE